MPHPTNAIDPVELQEFLFAQTSAMFALRANVEPDQIRDHVRSCLRVHRFSVMTWLMMQGVKIPVELLDDSKHPEVGQQMPDR